MPKSSKSRTAREGSFGFLVQTLARSLDARMKTETKKLGVDFKLFPALMLLFEEDGINQRKLGERLNFPEYFTSRNVDTLVKAGFAERHPDPESRRSFLIFLTEKGRIKAAQLAPIIKCVNEDALTKLSVTEKTQTIDLLQKAAGIGGDRRR